MNTQESKSGSQVLSDTSRPKDEAWSQKIMRAKMARAAAQEHRKGRPVTISTKRNLTHL